MAQQLGTAPQAGFVAHGAVTVYGKAGAAAGAITISVWGSGHRSVDIVFPDGSHYRSVVNGKNGWAQGSTAIVSIPPPAPYHGLSLLPQGLMLADASSGAVAGIALSPPAEPPPGGAAPPLRIGLRRGAAVAADPGASLPAACWLELDSTSGLPTSAGYDAGTHHVEVRYSQYQSGAIQSPRHVEMWSNGVLVLSADLTDVTPHSGFADSDFQVPAAKEGK